MLVEIGLHNKSIFLTSEHFHEDISLMRTGRLFGGLIADVKRKLPWYWSDFRDAFHVQSLASIIYIYLVMKHFTFKSEMIKINSIEGF